MRFAHSASKFASLLLVLLTACGPVHTRFVWQTITHVLNHGTQHRSEAAWLLTGYGHSPGDVTFNYYVHLQGGAAGGLGGVVQKS